MTLHYTPLGGGGRRGASPQRVYHGQNDAFRVDHGAKTARDLEVERLKQSLHGENAHVPDCLTWNVEDATDRKRDGGGYGSPRSPRKDYYSRRTADGREFSITSYKALPRHPELGRPKNHLYGDDGPPDVHWKQRPNEGGVADAMVGWPGTRRDEENDRYGRWEVDLGHGKGTARGNQMDSCRKDCNGKCQKKYSDMDHHDHHPHNAKSVPDRGCCDHRTCGCIPERHPPRHQVTYEDHSHLPPPQQQQQQRCPHCRGDGPSKNAFHVM